MTTFYTAGKVWHQTKFQNLRDTLGFPVKARWIDLTDDCDIVQNHKDKLWTLCFEDVRDSDFVLLYCEDMNEEQRGALVELGMAYGFGKSVYAVGTCKTIQPNKISDVALLTIQNSIGCQLLIWLKAQRWLCVSKKLKSK